MTSLPQMQIKNLSKLDKNDITPTDANQKFMQARQKCYHSHRCKSKIYASSTKMTSLPQMQIKNLCKLDKNDITPTDANQKFMQARQK